MPPDTARCRPVLGDDDDQETGGQDNMKGIQ